MAEGNDALKARVEALFEVYGGSRTKVAQAIGVAPGTLKCFLGGLTVMRGSIVQIEKGVAQIEAQRGQA